MYKVIVIVALVFGFFSLAVAQQEREPSFKPITIERGYFEVTRLPNKQFDGEIIVYEPHPETLERCDRCTTRYRLDKNFKVSVGAHITTEISLQELVRLPSQLAYFRLYREGTIGLIGFAELVEDDKQLDGI